MGGEGVLEKSLTSLSLSLPICKMELLPLPHYVSGHGGIPVMMRTQLSMFCIPPMGPVLEPSRWQVKLQHPGNSSEETVLDTFCLCDCHISYIRSLGHPSR